MSDPTQSAEFEIGGKQYRFEVLVDPDPQSPRENDNLGTMLYNHRRYVLGDDLIKFGSFEEYLDSANLAAEEVVSLPLYLLDHSGLSISTTDFNDQWDSACVGVIYTTFDKIKKEYGVSEVDLDLIERVGNVLDSEVSEFNTYLNKEIYGFRLCEKTADGQWNEVESGWNFYGSDVSENGMLEYLDTEIADTVVQHLARPIPRRLK